MKKEMNMNALTENDRKAWEAAHSNQVYEGEFDPSIFCEILVDELTGQETLYVPAENRIKWFRLVNPNCRFSISEVKAFNGRVVARAEVFKDKDDMYPIASNNAECSTSEKYATENASTRALSRALRVCGFALPLHPHKIEGWTPVDEGKSIPEDALENSVIIEKFLPDMDKILSNKPSQEEKSADVPAESEKQDKPVKKTKVVEVKPEPVAVVPEKVEEEQEAPKPFEELLKEAHQQFPTVEDAMNFPTRLLGGLSLKEAGEAIQQQRIPKYLEHIQKTGGLTHMDFARAVLVIADDKGMIA